MRTTTLLVFVAAATVILAAGASAGPNATKQRIAIQGQGATFTLKPLTTGVLKSDAGSASFCCWTGRAVIRDGQKLEVTNGPDMTLLGKRGTLEAHNRMEFLDVSGGYSLFTGTWKVVRGTGDYAGLAGGGRIAGVGLPNGEVKWRREGVLSPK
jgi:hypothetical protein